MLGFLTHKIYGGVFCNLNISSTCAPEEPEAPVRRSRRVILQGQPECTKGVTSFL